MDFLRNSAACQVLNEALKRSAPLTSLLPAHGCVSYNVAVS